MNQGLSKPLAAGSSPAVASFHIRGPQPRGWHLGQKQVPRFCIRTRDGAAADGLGFASLVSNLKIEMGCDQLALGADIGIHAGALLIQMPFRSLDKRAEYIYHFRRYDSGDEKRCHSRGDKRGGAE